MGSMTQARRARIRWGNMARVAVAVPAVVLVAAWPRLAGDPPVLPDDRATPLPVAPAGQIDRDSSSAVDAGPGGDAARPDAALAKRSRRADAGQAARRAKRRTAAS